MRFLGFLFVGLISSSILVWLDYSLSGTFLDGFLKSGFLETFAALAGFNIAAVIFLLGQLMDIEQKNDKKVIFLKSREEIKHNSYYLLGAFTLSFILLVLRPDPTPGFMISAEDALNNKIYYIFNVAIVCLFFLGIYAIFEILKSVFKLTNNK